jgi:hypothetical protein
MKPSGDLATVSGDPCTGGVSPYSLVLVDLDRILTGELRSDPVMTPWPNEEDGLKFIISEK